uniref:Uncharacterized protein n=1 Tax=Siphoviridae sp. ctX5W26 TaxID=2825540 RepID=A0A8S5UEL2_9CAUD|nr:MAG TPA: hypothetical protein [Siphoviridae sp. ctX5W26]
MIRYRNLSVVSKSYYGVTFRPGEVKEVPGYIHSRYFEVVTDTKEESKTSESTKSPKKKQISQSKINNDFKISTPENASVDDTVDTSEETTTQVKEEPTNLKSEKIKEE